MRPHAFVALLSAALLPVVAHAACEPLIAAYDKADATQRYALYEVDAFAQAVKGDPLVVVIGDSEYAQQYDSKKGYAKNGYLKTSHRQGFEGGRLKDNEKRGSMRCEPLGERKIGSEAVVGYRTSDATKKKGTPDPSAMDVWVSKATGLPLVHGMASEDGGFRWVYGSAVVAPAAGAGK